MRRILFVFLDGVGLGPAGPANPLSPPPGTAFRRLGAGAPWTRALPETATARHLVRPLDATLEVDGLPQSGTGQATLFTGVNCAERVGRHFGPYPHSATHDVLDHENLFHRVQALSFVPDEAVAFANAFPPQFFDASSRRWTVTTRCCAGAGVPLRDLDALRAHRAVAADLTAQGWRDTLQLDVSLRTPAEAAEALVATHRDHTLTLFEFFQTDKVGHERIDLPPSVLLARLDKFLGRLLALLHPDHDTLIVTSDHGNLEDTSHTQHTRNPVPLIAFGWGAPHLADAQTLADVTPAIVEALRTGLGGQ
ncbi:alkaline phosphatase family protein [Salinibacter altiplanensis]|uniref:alkaline phosphatase family protein n=1 Tax=Salinibacter altiplanensis TaxID=1803181 RepID=UPI000C9EEF7D|nr:alkaline phosphatase family protein [Salinibacter altiplanensis]